MEKRPTNYETRVGRYRYLWRERWNREDWQTFRRLEKPRRPPAARR